MASAQLYSGSIPANYEKYLGPYLFEPYALDIVELLQSDDCKLILELACGTGRVTNHLLKLISNEGKIIATDINPDMLQIAQTKVTDSKIAWRIADAHELPFDDNTFDHVICQFGVMFFTDKQQAFKEVYRVLSPQGKFVFNCWDSLDGNKRVGAVRDVMEDVFGNEAPDFLQKGAYSFYNVAAIKTLLDAAGFKNITIGHVHKIAPYTNVEDYINGYVDGTPLSTFLQARDASMRDVVKQKLRDALGDQFNSNPATEMTALVCTAVKS
jgi:ubiquinone/menaquinone biosynthesis C-methylase UbiE